MVSTSADGFCKRWWGVIPHTLFFGTPIGKMLTFRPPAVEELTSAVCHPSHQQQLSPHTQ